jgi:hypothetical protein
LEVTFCQKLEREIVDYLADVNTEKRKYPA